MATALTTETAFTCPTDVGSRAPIAALELIEAPDAHTSPIRALAQMETVIHAVEGVVYIVAGDEDWILTPGDSATIPAETPYRAWNAGDDEARWVEVYCSAA